MTKILYKLADDTIVNTLQEAIDSNLSYTRHLITIHEQSVIDETHADKVAEKYGWR